MPRKQKKLHYIYKTTCCITNRFYYGMHSTNNLEDGYIGSGQKLWHSINKHGRENHSIEILEYYDDRKSLKSREKELVNDDMLKDPMCMNLRIGGEGGGGFFNKEHAKKFHQAGGRKVWNDFHKKNIERAKKDLQFRAKWNNSISKSLKGNRNTLGMNHSKESKEKMSKSQLGSNNSQYGTCWITNESENKKIYKGDLIPEGWRLGRKIKIKKD